MDNNDPDLYQTVNRLGERVSTLEQRVGEAYSVVNQTSVIIGTVNGRLDSLDQSMTRLATTVIHELSEQNRRLEGVENRMAGVEGRIASVDNRIVGVESHVASIDNHVVRVENRIAGLDDRMVSLDNRMIGIEGHVANIDNRVAGVESRVTGLSDQIAGIDNRMVGTESRIAGLDDRVAGFDSNLGEFRRELEDKIDRANNRTVGYMALMFGAVGVIVGLITYF